MVDSSDANSLAVPYGLFPSKDEPIPEVRGYMHIDFLVSELTLWKQLVRKDC